MGKSTAICLVCVQPTPDVPDYSDWVCRHCGQAYVYNEGHAIELTAHQFKLLRKDKGIEEPE